MTKTRASQPRVLQRIPQVKHYHAQGLLPDQIKQIMNAKGDNLTRYDINYIIRKCKLVRGKLPIKEYK